MAGIVDKIQKMWRPADDEYEEYDEYEDDNVESPVNRTSYYDEDEDKYSFSSFSSYSRDITPRGSGGSVSTNSNKVVNINAKAQLQVVLFKPTSFGDDTRIIADELINRHTVILNLERTDKDTSRRIVDFLSGVAYANNGKIKRIATNTFMITPYNVDLIGDDILDEIEQSGAYF